MRPVEPKITAEIATLKEMQTTVRHHDMFGGDNREKIGAQIRVLEECMDEDDICDVWPNDVDVRMNASDALAWLTGGSDEKPSDGWAPICGK
jgi:hypothetical protein